MKEKRMSESSSSSLKDHEACGATTMKKRADDNSGVELLEWTRDLLTNLEMRPDHQGFAGYSVHEELLRSINVWLLRYEG
jgi:hypothetical protein